MNWNSIVVIICLLLAVFTVWKEYRRENRLRLVWRIVASIIAIAALACIALPITYSAKTINSNKEGVLLTPGFAADSLNAYQNAQLFTMESAIQKANPKLKITLVADLNDFANGQYKLSLLHVLGSGLDEEELKQLQNFPIKFHPSVLPPGITTISWDHYIKAGERLNIQGKFDNSTHKKISLVLKGLSTGLDSVTLPAKAKSNFSLSFIPKNAGRVAYNLLAVSGKDTLENEAIPFEVEPAKPLKILMLASAPDFENKFLKNWLSKNGYSLTVRTNISKGKFSREYVNMPQITVDNITPALLAKFDVVIGDLSAFKTLTSPETSALKEQVSAKGLGVIVKADSSKGASFLSASFPIEKLQVKEGRSSPVFIAGKTTPSANIILDVVALQNSNNVLPLVSDAQSHALASSTIYGEGKIVYTLLNNSYTWALSGKDDDYTALWSLLISKAAKKIAATETWSTSSAFPKINAPIDLTLEGPTVLPAKVYVTNSLLAFKQNPDVPFQWRATCWPKTPGWQQVSQNNTNTYWWYVYPDNGWNTLLSYYKLTKTEQFIAKNNSKSTVSASTENTIQLPVSKIYFYLLLLLSCAYLWIERKL